MNKDRAMELLNATIDYLLIAEKTSEVIRTLLTIGFTKTELIDDFDFGSEEVQDVVDQLVDEME